MKITSIKALALELEVALLELNKHTGIELKYNRNIKASVAEAIRQLIEYKYSWLSPMALQILYSQFKDVLPEENADGELVKAIYIDEDKGFTKAMLHALEKHGLVTNYWATEEFHLTKKGQSVIDAINARLETLRAKKRGSDLFPDLAGTDSCN